MFRAGYSPSGTFTPSVFLVLTGEKNAIGTQVAPNDGCDVPENINHFHKAFNLQQLQEITPK